MASSRFLGRLRRRGHASHASSPGGTPTSDREERSPESQWFWDHYDVASKQIVEAFEAEGIALADRAVADIGCGEGFMDLGVLHKARPRSLVGFDLNPTNTAYLEQRAREEGVDYSDSVGLTFEQSGPTKLPANDETFDVAFSWSAFEHIAQPIKMLTEVRRILVADGAFFLQLWPFYLSAKGSHLWEWFPEDYHHLQRPESDVAQELLEADLKPREWTEMMAREFRHLNRITVDELQRSVLAAGLVTRRLELLASPTRLTPQLDRYSWLDLGISGIKLIATPS